MKKNKVKDPNAVILEDARKWERLTFLLLWQHAKRAPIEASTWRKQRRKRLIRTRVLLKLDPVKETQGGK